MIFDSWLPGFAAADERPGGLPRAAFTFAVMAS